MIEGLFYQAFYRIDKYFKACEKVSENIKEKLMAIKGSDGESEFEGLLVGIELKKTLGTNWYSRWRLKIYGLVSIVGLIALILLVFVVIQNPTT
jgi:hypothetical protein